MPILIPIDNTNNFLHNQWRIYTWDSGPGFKLHRPWSIRKNSKKKKRLLLAFVKSYIWYWTALHHRKREREIVIYPFIISGLIYKKKSRFVNHFEKIYFIIYIYKKNHTLNRAERIKCPMIGFEFWGECHNFLLILVTDRKTIFTYKCVSFNFYAITNNKYHFCIFSSYKMPFFFLFLIFRIKLSINYNQPY